MSDKLNTMRILEQNKIVYEALHYPDDLRDAEEIADVLGLPYYMVYKTLVAQPEGSDKPYLVMIAADRALDLKQLAAVSGQKKIRMASHKDAEALTGLKVGGISALALTQKNWTVFLDQPATEHEHILISAGQRGIQLRVPTMALVRLVRARLANVSMDKPEGGEG
ncbi:MAG: YbaK/EbsC family protein [Chloroflexota bacterium]|nr:YbaK/EbsC family protein [Chloroflexota bacterium]